MKNLGNAGGGPTIACKQHLWPLRWRYTRQDAGENSAQFIKRLQPLAPWVIIAAHKHDQIDLDSSENRGQAPDLEVGAVQCLPDDGSGATA